MTTEPETETPSLSLADAKELADALLAELAQHIGDAEQIDAVGRRWFEVLDERLLLVSLVALREVFADCLTITDPGAWPAGGTEFTQPADREDNTP